MSTSRVLSSALAVAIALWAAPSGAVPAFARKYGTSCTTCHTIYPKLNGFGESFRRNGFRFPGVDSDAVRQDPIALGQERDASVFPLAIWPGTLPAGLPLAISFNGQAVAHPDVNSGGGQADNRTAFSLRDLVAEAHLWAAGSFDDTLTYFAQLTVSTAGTIDLENAELHVNDLVGPAHALNLVAGKGSATLSSFGPHSSYLADTLLPSAPLAGLYGSTTPTFSLTSHAVGVELNGLAWGRLTYALGLNAGANLDLRPSENVYAHVGVLLAGRRLDEGLPEQLEPGLTVDAFGYHANSRFRAASGAETQDAALVAGGSLRATFSSLELDVGLYWESHDHARADDDPLNDATRNGASMLVHYDELSWMALRWLVPVVRIEYFAIAAPGADRAWDLRVTPGVAVLVRQNLKLSLLARFEAAHGAPTAGWSQAGGAALPTAAQPTVPFENESVLLRLDAAF